MGKSTETSIMDDLDFEPSDFEHLAELHKNIPNVKWNEMTADVSKTRKRQHKPMYRDTDGDTVLHLLIVQEHKDRIEYIQKKADLREINAVNHQGQTPLHLAIYLGDIATVEAIMSTGFVDLERYDNQMNTPLHLACQRPNDEATKITKFLLEKISFRSIINAKNEDGLVPIHLASHQKNLELIQILVEKGADINLREGKTGKTSLMMVSELGASEDMITQLIECLNAKVSMMSYCENTALHFACQANCKEAVQVLLQNGAEVGIKNIHKKTEKDLTSNSEIKKMLDSQWRKKRRKRYNSKTTNACLDGQPSPKKVNTPKIEKEE